MEKTYDSVFDIANDEELEFEAIFGDDDELADTIVGVDEDGNSLIFEEDEFAELHQTDDEATPDDIRDELGPDHDEDFGNKDAEGTDEVDLDNDQEIKDLEKNGESDAEKELGLDKLDDEYQDGKADGKAPDADNVTDVVEKELKEATDMFLALEGVDLIAVNEVSFKFLPSLKEDSGTRQLWGACKDAEVLLNGEGVESKADAEKFCKVALRILDLIQNVASFFYLPFCITIVGIPIYLLVRAWSWLFRFGEEKLAESYFNKTYAKLNQLAKECKDPKKKKEILEKAEKLKDKFDKLTVNNESAEMDIDDELDPASAPNDTADGKEHPVSGEIPSDTGEGEPTNECGNCPEMTPEVIELIKKAEAAGFIVKKAECIEDIIAKLRELGFEVEQAPAAEAPAEEPAAPVEGCREEVEDAEIVKSDDELAPEGDEEYNDDDTASVGEAGEVDIDDELDDEVADEVESSDGDASVDLEYDPSDEDIIDMVLQN